MSCGSCASHVKKSVKFLQGVNNVEVSLEKRQAKVSYFPQKISATKIQEAISASGYKAGKPVVQKDK
ncbi:heavy-metal-associated domain-containing protein [Mucilaginibacter rubeus]|nr:heavy-metal-associated domain-containing protein [Mucilaginibacter rubeus]QEM20741.1 heavy-metal-associated domain-containing protein [Mucilaginibacter gossypii]